MQLNSTMQRWCAVQFLSASCHNFPQTSVASAPLLQNPQTTVAMLDEFCSEALILNFKLWESDITVMV